MKHISNSLQDTKQIGQEFLKNLVANQHQATVVALHGNLGSGKTTFTQAVAEILGVQEHVTSPTFIIEKIYKIDHAHFSHLIHIDAYRLDKSGELVNLGWKKILENNKNLILIEWPEKVADILPENMVKIEFKFVDQNTREIFLPPFGHPPLN